MPTTNNEFYEKGRNHYMKFLLMHNFKIADCNDFRNAYRLRKNNKSQCNKNCSNVGQI